MKIEIGGLCSIALCVMIGLLPQSADAKTVEESVRDYFKETPVMIEIARCESKFRQFTADGLPLYGGMGGGMIGVFQFYDRIHRAGATALGFNLATLEGNLAYAKHVYATSGTTPWNSSKKCWQNASPNVSVVSLSEAEKVAALEKHIEELKKTLTDLQKQLKAKKKVVHR
jgi:hypothetical protein